MSEIQNTRIFKSVETLRPVDAYTEDVMLQASRLERFVSKAYNDPSCTELELLQVNQEATERIAKMNQECPYIGKLVQVTGDVDEAYLDTPTEEIRTRAATYQQEGVWSAGYMMHTVTLDDGTKDVQVGHLFNLADLPSIAHESTHLMRLTPTLYAFARTGQVDIETFGVDSHHDGERLEREIPELFKELHGRIAGEDDECIRLANLARMHAPVAYDLPLDTQRRFEAYAYTQLRLDPMLPYALTARGIVARIDVTPSDLYDFGDERQLYGIPERIVFEPIMIANEDGAVTPSKNRYWSLLVRALGHDCDDNDQQYLLPICRLLGMQSVRNDLHASIQLDADSEPSDEDYAI